MATATTNTILTQIALKRLSGKALTSGKQSLPQEPFGSTVQSSATTIFGEIVPNTANTGEANLFYIQSASITDPGTIQLVDFDLIPLANGKYQNVTDADNDTEESGYNADTGVTTVDTFHAYMLRLTGSYEADTTAIGATYFADNASTSKVLGTNPEFSDNFIASASVQFQVVPEYLSTEVGSSNPYIPVVIASDGSSTIPFTDSSRNMYFDAFSGILFVQDPVDYGTTTDGVDGFDLKNSAATIPAKLRAFLYTGKYQSEIEGGNFHISGSEGGGFSISGTVTASFETGSGDGLTITADPNANSLTFELNNVASGSTLFHIDSSATDDLGFSVTPNSSFTASFISGSAGLTVKTNGSNIVSIGDATDNVEFNNGLFNGNVTVEGDVIAQNYIVSSSVTYMTQSFSSGSTIFGDTVGGANADTHQFTGSIFVTGSTFTWDGLGSSDGTTPLVIDEDGNITSGPAFSAATGIHLSASGDEGFTLQSSDTASFVSANSQLTIEADANTSEFTFTVGGGVVSGSAQLLTGSGILSSSTQNFTEYSSSVETLISDATASILVNETNITELQASASAGIAVSSSGGVTSIALTETASFIGGDGITVTNSNGEITITSDYGELNSPIYISASGDTGTSIEYGATASFSASGPGLTVSEDTGEINYDINANTLIEAVDTATVINITASYATSASYALSSSYSVTASYAENAGSVSVTEDNATNELQTVIFSSLEDDDAGGSDVNEDVTLKAANFLSVDAGRKYLYVSGGDGYTRIEHNAIQTSVSNPTAYNIFTAGGTTDTINMGVSSGTVFFKGSASIDGDLIVKGTTTTLNTTNLLVEDKYILIASGSSTPSANGGGIIVERSAQNVGTALHWDEATERWGIDTAGADASTATTKTIEVTLTTVQIDSDAPSTAPLMGATSYNYGQMYVQDSAQDDGNGIWIYAP